MIGFPDLPDIAVAQPAVRHFHLLPVFDFLSEQAIAVPDAVAVAGKVQGCERIEETRCQTSQAAVAQSCIGFERFHLVDVNAKIGQPFLDYIINAQVAQVVGHETSHQELHGKIVKLFCLGPPDGFFGFLPVVSGIIPDQGTQCLIAFDWIRVLKIMAKLAGDPFLVAFYESIF